MLKCYIFRKSDNLMFTRSDILKHNYIAGVPGVGREIMKKNNKFREKINLKEQILFAFVIP